MRSRVSPVSVRARAHVPRTRRRGVHNGRQLGRRRRVRFARPVRLPHSRLRPRDRSSHGVRATAPVRPSRPARQLGVLCDLLVDCNQSSHSVYCTLHTVWQLFKIVARLYLNYLY